MATVTHRIATASTLAGPWTSGAFTPAAGELLVVLVGVTLAATVEPVGLVSSVGLPFVRVGPEIAAKSNSIDKLAVYVAMEPATAVSQTVTFSSTPNGNGCVIFVAGVSGMARFGIPAVRQIGVQHNQAAGATPTITFRQTTLTGNPILGAVFNQTNPAGITPPTSFTEDATGDTGYATPTTGMEYAFRSSGHTATTVVWGSTYISAGCAVALELDTDAVPVLSTVPAVGQAHPARYQLGRWQPEQRQAAAPAGGTVFTINLDGSITPVGSIVKDVGKPVAGSITPTGSVARATSKTLAGLIAPVGTLAKLVAKVVGGTVAPSGSLTQRADKALAGSVTPAGTMTRATSKFLGGATTPVGALAKLVSKPLAGAITPTGTLTTLKVALLNFAGSITPTGTLTRQTLKGLAGTITPSGSLARAVAKLLVGVIAPQGSLERRAFKAFAGAIAPAGSLATQVINFGGAVYALGRAALSDVAAFMVGLGDRFTFGRRVSDDSSLGTGVSDRPTFGRGLSDDTHLGADVTDTPEE